MKNICFLTYNPFKFGGIEKVVSVISNGLIKENYKVTILCVDSSSNINREIYNLDEKVKILFTNVDQYYHKYFHLLEKILKEIHLNTKLLDKKEKLIEFIYFNRHKKLIKNIEEIINKNNFDYVIGVNGFFSIILGMLKSKCKAKMIGWQHSNYEAYFEKKGYYYFKQDIIAKHYLPNLDNYITLLEYDKQIIKDKLNIDATCISNPKTFRASKRSLLKNKIFISTGRFVDAKGYDLLIEIFYLFSKKNSDWNLILVGDGKNKKKIIDKINDYNLTDRVIIHPFTKNIEKLLTDSSIYLCSSRWEGFGLSVLEAIECGLPVISFSIPSMKEILCNSPEFLVDLFNIHEYSEKMLKLVKEAQNLSIIAKKNEIILKEYELDKILSKWKKILK